MKVQELRWLFIAVVVAFLIVANFSDPITIGVSGGTTNGRYGFSGGTSPIALIFAAVIVLLYVLLMYSAPANLRNPLPGVLRRFASFWLDFLIAMTAVSPILGILPTLTEWKRTGLFQWSFNRTTYASGDTLIATIGAAVCAAGLFLYFALPLVRRKPSPGSCIVGYQVIPDEGTTLNLRKAMLRNLFGFFAVATCYFVPFVARDRKKGKFWVDKAFRTHAVKLN